VAELHRVLAGVDAVLTGAADAEEQLVRLGALLG
jgi:hypothetical protein